MNKRQEGILKIAKEFKQRWGVVPCNGFLAGYFKVTMETIRKDLIMLEKLKKVKRLKTDKYYCSYRLQK